MPKPKKDGHFINIYLDRNLYNRLRFYAEKKGQTKTTAIERALKERFDQEGIPDNPPEDKEEQ